MGRVLALITALLLLFPVPGAAHDSRAALETASKALGADGLKTLQYSASGDFAIGQSRVPGRVAASTSRRSRADQLRPPRSVTSRCAARRDAAPRRWRAVMGEVRQVRW
jgi:hypothetical protein